VLAQLPRAADIEANVRSASLLLRRVAEQLHAQAQPLVDFRICSIITLRYSGYEMSTLITIRDKPSQHAISLYLSILILSEYMKTQKSKRAHSIRRLLLMVPAIYSMAFAACSDFAGTARTHATVNLRSAAVGTHQADDNVTIGPRTYNSKNQSFDRPWPFGPEFNPQ
jgi:hypothetical protein